jgi:hypothetical protein
MARIESLTDAQTAQFSHYVREWTDIGLDTKPADRPAAEAAVVEVYRAGGLTPPKRVEWHLSPMAMCEATGSNPAQCIYGQHDAGWLSFYAFMGEVLGLSEVVRPLQGLMALARSCGWGVPLSDVCHLSERPSALRRDDAGRMHALDNPSLEYPDGRAIYAVRGVRVPAEWVKSRRTLDPTIALTERNVERRAAAATLIGWDRVLEHLKPVLVDSERSPEYDFGRLLKVDLPGEPGQLFLQVMCPTGRTMVLRVPPTMKSAREANAWTYGRDAASFSPQGRT